MTKFKTTRKNLVSNHHHIVYIPYVEAQTLLSVTDPVAYTAGSYGWNFDVYCEFGITICTGYRGMPGKRAVRVKEFEAKARQAKESAHTWSDFSAVCWDLLESFCKANLEVQA